MITEAVSTITFAAGLMGWPLVPSSVVPLEDHLAASASNVNPRALTNYRRDGKSRVGVWVPNALLDSSDSSTSLTCPISDQETRPRFGGAFTLTSDLPANDAALLQRALGSEDATSSEVLVGMEEAGEAQKPADAATNTLSAKVTIAKMAFGAFRTEAWKKAKLTPFTKLLKDFAGLAAEAALRGDHTGNALAESWTVGLSLAKSVISTHAGFAKYQGGTATMQRLQEVADHCVKLTDFLKNNAITICPSLQTFTLRALFEQKFADGQSLASAFRAIKERGLSAAFPETKTGMGEDGSPTTLFLRVLFQEGLKRLFLAKLEEGVNAHARLKIIVDEVQATIDLLRPLAEEQRSVEAFVQEATDLHTFLSVGAQMPNISAKSLQKAVKMISSPTYRLLVTSVESTGLWDAAKSATASAVQASSKDVLADGKLEKAMATLREVLPSFVCDETSKGDTPEMEGESPDDTGETPNVKQFKISNFDAIADLSIVDTIEEAMTLVTEAVTMWSPLRLEEQTPNVSAFADMLTNMLNATDSVLGVFYTALVHGPLRELSSFPDVSSDVLATLRARIRNSCPDTTQWATLTGRIKTMLERFPRKLNLKNDRDLFEYLDAIEADISKHVAERSSLLNALLLISTMARVPSSPEEALEEWGGDDGNGKKESSFLAKALALLQAVNSAAAQDDEKPDVGFFLAFLATLRATPTVWQ